MKQDEPDIKTVRKEILMQEIHSSDEASMAIFRWILASLVLVNSGFLVAAAGIEEIGGNNFSATAWPFVASLFLGILSGLCMCLAYSFLASDIRNRLWADEYDGFENFTSFFHDVNPIAWPFWLGFAFLIASAGLFVFGCFELSYVLNER